MKYKDETQMTDAEFDALRSEWIRKQIDSISSVHQIDGIDVSESPQFLAIRRFYDSGDVSNYIGELDDLGIVPSWSTVASYTFNRDLDSYLNNISIFWDWVLQNTTERVLNPHLYKGASSPENGYFWSVFHTLPSGPVVDTSITLKLFRMIYGSEFVAVNDFPLSLGVNEWVPQIYIDPVDTFVGIMMQIERYLFDQDIDDGDIVVLPDLNYWYSLIPVIKKDYVTNSGAFSLKHDLDRYLEGKMTGNEKKAFEQQDAVRRFLGSLLGYHVNYEYTDKLEHHDIDVEHQILSHLESVDWPPNYYRLIDFIHRHKEEAMNASETD
ncbi:hypothetical protein [Arenicella xantha]|uniref:Uncharacterized protein n=1 Tax=Arenicella xantha TaxID=644221 RepID=A0A395JK03_9GAMM|nr:hypothetical protein [Arenicella xantha]RBP50745.1 hypothetical protein DFR28_102157 [Arenicella xantha]